ncbi:MAG: hypothetical protein K1X64_20550 [Myxococcaceae bacterium]|nr:hypothetical protein [Myxococcaceae bacterium]
MIATASNQPTFTLAGIPSKIEVSFFVRGALLGASRANGPALWVLIGPPLNVRGWHK